LEDNEFYFNCYNETYLTLSLPEGERRVAYFTEDWIYAGIGYQIPKYGRIEVGPLAQFLLYRSPTTKNVDFRNLFLLQIAWITNFNFRKR
jgi:hypothetical protein